MHIKRSVSSPEAREVILQDFEALLISLKCEVWELETLGDSNSSLELEKLTRYVSELESTFRNEYSDALQMALEIRDDPLNEDGTKEFPSWELQPFNFIRNT